MDNNNLIAAVVLSVLILVGFQYFYVKPHQEEFRQQVLAQKAVEVKDGVLPDTATVQRDRAEVIKESPRVAIHTPQLMGSINLKGARIDDLSLVQYRETVADNSPNVVLLSPSGSAAPYKTYYTDISWLADKDVSVPTSQTLWKANGTELTPAHPLMLTWDNGQGLQFQRTISVDHQFMFTVSDHVTNKGSTAVSLYPFGTVARQGNPVISGSNVLHEGPLGRRRWRA